MDLIIRHQDKPCTTSRLIAKKFGKQHKNVLKDIKELGCSDNFRGLNFELSSYTSNQNKQLPEYIITKDGFTFLVMGYTGKQAASFKEDYINAFNMNERKLLTVSPQTEDQLILSAMNVLVKKVEASKKTIAKLQPKADFADRVLDTEELIDIGQTAKILGLDFGRNTLFKKLREQNIFFKNRNEPFQRYIDAGLFKLKEQLIKRDSHKDFIAIKVLVTQKGLKFLSERFGNNNLNNQIAKTA